MQQSLPDGTRTFTAPSFSLIGRQPLRPGAIILAILTATGALCSGAYAMNHSRHAGPASRGSNTAQPDRASANSSAAEDKDDPNQIDTIVLGDPADAPVPGRHGDHVSPVHPTIVVRLPRYGDETGKIPATPAGRFLYNWLAAFNQANPSKLADALPNIAPAFATAAQVELRKQTGGFTLLSAKEVEPGVLVFRLRDQTPPMTEVLGTLQVRPGSIPAAIASFSLRAVVSPRKDSTITTVGEP